MRIWLLGTEGRMAALARHFKSHGHEVFFSGIGCPGTERHAQRIEVDLKEPHFARVRWLAANEKFDLVIPGSEDLLDAGIVNSLTDICPVFGPTKTAARLETDKEFSFDLMDKKGIRQAWTRWTSDYDNAMLQVAIHFCFSTGPIVIKPRGRTGGKGVVVAATRTQAEAALTELITDKKYGEAGQRVGIADYLKGPECSVFILSDGHEDTARLFGVARDCKPAYPAKDGNPAGPNTGGMWSVSPIPDWNARLESETLRIARAVIKHMRETGTPFNGCLYIALKLTDKGPKVVEFNVRFGDPEAQAILQRVDSDIAPVLLACAKKKGLAKAPPIVMSQRVGGCLVIAAPNYPDKPVTGKKIRGIELAERFGVNVEHCGTKLNENKELVSSGGRVLNLNASADTLPELRRMLTHAASLINFEGGQQYRDDLGDPAAAS